MQKLVTLLAAACICATPALAQSFRAENRVTVTSVPGGFEVANGGGFGARGMWCAAADYARSVLGARGIERIYVAEDGNQGLGKRGPVRFSLSAPDGVARPAPFFVVGGTPNRAGANLSVDHAIGFCADAKVINR